MAGDYDPAVTRKLGKDREIALQQARMNRVLRLLKRNQMIAVDPGQYRIRHLYCAQNRPYKILRYSTLRLYNNLIHSQFVFRLTCLSVYLNQTHVKLSSSSTLRPMQATTTLYFQFNHLRHLFPSLSILRIKNRRSPARGSAHPIFFTALLLSEMM